VSKVTLREAVEFFLRHNRADAPRLTLAEVAEQFAASRRQAGCSKGVSIESKLDVLAFQISK
jgi:hypothetical protein